MDVDSYLLAGIQINSKWIEDLNARPKTTKMLKEKIGGYTTIHGHRQELAE